MTTFKNGIWYQVGSSTGTLRKQRFARWDEAEVVAKRTGRNVYFVDYHGTIGEMPSPRNANRPLA